MQPLRHNLRAKKLFSKKIHPRGNSCNTDASRVFNSEINIFSRQKGENKCKKRRLEGDFC